MSKRKSALTREKQKRLSKQLQRYGGDFGKFSTQGLSKSQKRNIKERAKFERKRSCQYEGYLGSLSEVDQRFGNGGCCFQWFCTQLAAIAVLAPEFEVAIAKRREVYFVTTAAPPHQRSLGTLETVTVRSVTRKFDSLPKTRGFSFATTEINLYHDLDGREVFQPHMHLIVAGLSRDTIEMHFRYKSEPRHLNGRRKSSTQIKPINSMRQLLHFFIYMTKWQPELKTAYLDGHGHRASSRAVMQHERGEWASWFGSREIKEVVRMNGFSSDLKDRFWECRLNDLVNDVSEICVKRKRHASGMRNSQLKRQSAAP